MIFNVGDIIEYRTLDSINYIQSNIISICTSVLKCTEIYLSNGSCINLYMKDNDSIYENYIIFSIKGSSDVHGTLYMKNLTKDLLIYDKN